MLARVLSRMLVAAVLSAGVSPSTLAAQGLCGVERWPVKIWADHDAKGVDTLPTPITVAQLAQIPRPDTTPWPQSGRVGAEFRTYVVRARLAEVRPQDDDSDIHLVLRDPDVPHVTLIAEIPDSACTADTVLKAVFVEARRVLRSVPRNGLVEVVGLGFFDRDHGQRGLAPNGIEIHPVLRLRSLESPPPAGPLSDPRDSSGQRQVPDSVFADSVWVNSSSGVYHCRGTQWFGRTVRGYFISEQQAMQVARPAGGRRCGSRR